LAAIGFAMLAWFFYDYRTLDVNTSDWGIIWPTMIRGVGVAMLIAPLTATAMNAVPKSSAGMASSMLNIVQQAGGSVGIAILGLVLHRRSLYHLSILGAGASSSSPAFRDAAHALTAHGIEIGLSHAESARTSSLILGGYIGKTASVMGFQDAFLVGSFITILVLAGVFLLPNKPIHHAAGEPVHLE
jgi:DHA2 family multidrug resistance protein